MKRSPFPRSGRPTEGDRVGGGEDRRKALFSMTGSKMRWRMNWWSIIALKEGETRDRRWWMYRRKKERAEEREEERMEGEERRVLGLCYSRRSKEVENERMTYAHNGWESRVRRWRMSLMRKKQGKLQKGERIEGEECDVILRSLTGKDAKRWRMNEWPTPMIYEKRAIGGVEWLWRRRITERRKNGRWRMTSPRPL